MTIAPSGSSTSSPTTLWAHPLKLIAIGDSLVYGYGDAEGGGWVERCRRAWMHDWNPGVILYNLGIRGDGVSQVLQRFDTEFRSRGELRHRVPDGLILSVGLNDSARLGRPDGRNMTEFEQFQQDMATLLQHARQLCPVWVVGMPPVDERQMPYAGCLYFNQADQTRYKAATRRLCDDMQVPYLDIFEQWLAQGDEWWRSRLSEDGIHPNVAGYRSLYEAVTTWDSLMHFVQDSQIDLTSPR